MNQFQVRLNSGTDDTTMTADCRDDKRPFSSGAIGYSAQGKVVLDGKRYQVSCNIVEIESTDPDERAALKAARLASK